MQSEQTETEQAMNLLWYHIAAQTYH